jgi:rhodanese-related sulfurtransferase
MKSVIVDVRTPEEHKKESIPGSINIPMDSDLNDFELLRNNTICLICESGRRANLVMQTLHSKGYQDVSIMDMQMSDIRDQHQTAHSWNIDRQFRFILAAFLGFFLIGSNTGLSVFIGIPIIIASGLLFSAITDNCYLKIAIAKLPWNKAV